MFSIVLPAGGSYSFYVECVLRNVYETCGFPPNEVDFVILTERSIHPRLKDELFALSFKYNFRVVQSPVEGELHLWMLDWLVRNDKELADWIVPIHMDGFWYEKDNWLVEYKNQIESNPKGKIVTIGAKEYWTTYFLQDDWLSQTYDHIGAYNCDFLRDKDLSFKWGSFSDFTLSPKLLQFIEEKKILTRGADDNWANLYPIPTNHWFDGSVLIGIESAINWPETVISINKPHKQYHIGSFNRQINTISASQGELRFNVAKKEFYDHMHRWAFHSVVTSYFLDKDVYSDVIFPWALLKCHASNPFNTKDFGTLLNIFVNYFGFNPNHLGSCNSNNINKLKLRDSEMKHFKLF